MPLSSLNGQALPPAGISYRIKLYQILLARRVVA